ncbi:consensus disorder prediction [Desulfoluna spongiiphila]|nr:consensus disorder prediction [Desulfoluna spongiiphila]
MNDIRSKLINKVPKSSNKPQIKSSLTLQYKQLSACTIDFQSGLMLKRTGFERTDGILSSRLNLRKYRQLIDHMPFHPADPQRADTK